MALQDKGGCRRNPRLAEKENETRGDRDRYGYLHHYHEVSLHLSRQDYAGTKEQQPILPDRIMNKQEYETLSAIVEEIRESDEQTDVLVYLLDAVKRMLKDYRQRKIE